MLIGCNEGYEVTSAHYAGQDIKYCEPDPANPSISRNKMHINTYVKGSGSNLFGRCIDLRIYAAHTHQCELEYRQLDHHFIRETNISLYGDSYNSTQCLPAGDMGHTAEFKLTCYPGRSKSSVFGVEIFGWTRGDAFVPVTDSRGKEFILRDSVVE